MRNAHKAHIYKNWIYLPPFVLLYIFAFILSWLTPLVEEDYWHSGARNFAEAYQHAHYSFFTYNARLGELLAHFLGHYTDLFDLIVTPISVISTAYLLYRWALLVTRGEQARAFTAAALSCLLTSMLCYYFWWHCSNMNWFHPCTLSLLTLWTMRRVLFGSYELSRKRYITLFPLTFLLGWSNEVVSFTTISIISLCLIYHSWTNKKLPPLKIVILLLSLIIGFAIVLSGALSRDSDAGGLSAVEKLVRLLWASDWILFFILFWRYLIISLCLMILLGLSRVRQVLFTPSFYLSILTFIATMCALSQAPAWGAPRSYQPLIILLIFNILVLALRIIPQLTRRKKIIFSIICLVLAYTQWLPIAHSAINSYKFNKEIVAETQAQKAAGFEHVVIQKQLTPDKSFYLVGRRVPHFILQKRSVWEPINDNETWCYLQTKDKRLPNEEFARSQGVKSVELKITR